MSLKKRLSFKRVCYFHTVSGVKLLTVFCCCCFLNLFICLLSLECLDYDSSLSARMLERSLLLIFLNVFLTFFLKEEETEHTLTSSAHDICVKIDRLNLGVCQCYHHLSVLKSCCGKRTCTFAKAKANR